MAFYNVWSRAFIRRSSALGFLAVGMGAGAVALVIVGLLTGRVAVLESFGAAAMDLAGIYLGIGGGALSVHSLGDGFQRASPTRVANTMTVNPIRRGFARRISLSASRSPSIWSLASWQCSPASGIATTETAPDDKKA